MHILRKMQNKINFSKYIILIIHIIILSTAPIPNDNKIENTNEVKPEDPNISNLIVSHYDCSKQHNLRQFNLLNVQSCHQAPSNIQHTRTQATVYVRAKAKRIKAFKCEAYVKTHRQYCTRPKDSIYRTDRMDWYTNSLELPKSLTQMNGKI